MSKKTVKNGGVTPMTFAELRALWSADLYRHTGQTSLRHLLGHVLFSDGDERFSDGVKYMFYFRTCRYLQWKRPRVIYWPLYRISKQLLIRYKYKFGCSIPHTTSIGRGFYIGHIRDIVINERAVIGDNCNISQGVTIGQANRGRHKGTPVIGDHVYIGPGAKIVGAVRVGDHAAIGANCVVTDDVPDYAVVVGVPGKVISFEGSGGYVNRTDYDLIREQPRVTRPAVDQQTAVSKPGLPAGSPGRRPATVIRAERDPNGTQRCAP